MPTEPMSTELQVALDAAKTGGRIVADYFEKVIAGTSTSDEKHIGSESQGLITQADLESEKAILTQIKSHFPSHSFLAEESGQSPESSEHLWIVDPLDGTNNFAHGIPHFAVSIAYYKNKVPCCGAVYDPISGDLFTAEKGRGAFHNSKQVHVNSHSSLNQSMIAVGFYYDRGEMMKRTLRSIEALFEQQIHGIRRMGTAAMDLVQVGLGRFGGYFEYTLSPWDFAAALLFVEEAGGRVTDCNGAAVGLDKTSILASNGKLHSKLLEIVSRP